MVRATTVAAALLTLSACSGQGAFEDARERYDFLKRNGAPAEQVCAQARRIANLAADLHQTRDYQLWQATAELDCNGVRLR